jgi:hypothetical protein
MPESWSSKTSGRANSCRPARIQTEGDREHIAGIGRDRFFQQNVVSHFHGGEAGFDMVLVGRISESCKPKERGHPARLVEKAGETPTLPSRSVFATIGDAPVLVLGADDHNVGKLRMGEEFGIAGERQKIRIAGKPG